MYELCRSGGTGLLIRCVAGSGLSHPVLTLHQDERRIAGTGMPPLLAGEFALLAYLGSRPRAWHTTRMLSVSVYHRTDPAGRELVWKYASTLRKKLGRELPDLIEVCRRRGYRCRERLIVI